MATQSWNDITDLFRSGARTNDDRKVGIEIERIGLWADGTALRYTDRTSATGEARPGAETLLRELEARYHWKAVTNDAGQPLGFSSPEGKVSLEPGSQLELSTEPAVHLPELIESVTRFEAQVDAVTKPWGLHWIGLGVNPVSRVDDIDVIPSTRYHIMNEYLGKHRLGTSMMRLTSSVQINLDYTSEAEGIEMLRVALAVVPVSYALFSNSPIGEGKENGFLSYRSAIWRETDPDRTGMLPEVFQADFDFSKYAEMVWNRPLMFAQDARGKYLPAYGKSLASIERGELAGVSIDAANAMNAVREIFTEARLKPGYIEIRAVDGLRPADRYAATAFWLGLLYSPSARRLALQHLGSLGAAERDQLSLAASREGLRASVRGKPLKSIAQELVTEARTYLELRRFGEEKFLDPVQAGLNDNSTPAERVLRQWRAQWKGNMGALIEAAGGQQ